MKDVPEEFLAGGKALRLSCTSSNSMPAPWLLQCGAALGLGGNYLTRACKSLHGTQEAISACLGHLVLLPSRHLFCNCIREGPVCVRLQNSECYAMHVCCQLGNTFYSAIQKIIRQKPCVELCVCVCVCVCVCC